MSFRRSFHNETIVKKNENDTSLINFIKKNDHFIMKTMTKNRKRNNRFKLNMRRHSKKLHVIFYSKTIVFPKTIVNIIVNKFFLKRSLSKKLSFFKRQS